MAHAYFTFRKDRIMGEAAEKRLSAIREFTELGSGFKIAMRDLEIRGAGNILGAEQHGHIAAVGFDLYSRLLEEAVREARGEETPKVTETTIELPVEAFIPGTYISDTNQKVEIYKRLAGLTSASELPELEDELVDRFGDLPEPVQNLLAVAKVRTMAGSLEDQNNQPDAGTVPTGIQSRSSPHRRRLWWQPAGATRTESSLWMPGMNLRSNTALPGDQSDSKFLLRQLEDFLTGLGNAAGNSAVVH